MSRGARTPRTVAASVGRTVLHAGSL
eukprot:SAG11_NODE_29697_length_308_cov_0.746411_1_plen_25_part_01